LEKNIVKQSFNGIFSLVLDSNNPMQDSDERRHIMVVRLPAWLIAVAVIPGAMLALALSMPGIVKVLILLAAVAVGIATLVYFDREQVRVRALHTSKMFLNNWARQHREIKLTLPVPDWLAWTVAAAGGWSVYVVFEVLGSSAGVFYLVAGGIAAGIGIAYAEWLEKDQEKRPRDV
jgi:hypothetical protein